MGETYSLATEIEQRDVDAAYKLFKKSLKRTGSGDEVALSVFLSVAGGMIVAITDGLCHTLGEDAGRSILNQLIEHAWRAQRGGYDG